MFGVVGNIKINYNMNNKQYEEIVDPLTTEEFCLNKCEQVKFRVEEVTYIEDTIYGVVLSMLEPEYYEEDYIVSNNAATFDVEKFGITGRFLMCY